MNPTQTYSLFALLAGFGGYLYGGRDRDGVTEIPVAPVSSIDNSVGDVNDTCDRQLTDSRETHARHIEDINQTHTQHMLAINNTHAERIANAERLVKECEAAKASLAAATNHSLNTCEEAKETLKSDQAKKEARLMEQLTACEGKRHEMRKDKDVADNSCEEDVRKLRAEAHSCAGSLDDCKRDRDAALADIKWEKGRTAEADSRAKKSELARTETAEALQREKALVSEANAQVQTAEVARKQALEALERTKDRMPTKGENVTSGSSADLGLNTDVPDWAWIAVNILMFLIGIILPMMYRRRDLAKVKSENESIKFERDTLKEELALQKRAPEALPSDPKQDQISMLTAEVDECKMEASRERFEAEEMKQELEARIAQMECEKQAMLDERARMVHDIEETAAATKEHRAALTSAEAQMREVQEMNHTLKREKQEEYMSMEEEKLQLQEELREQCATSVEFERKLAAAEEQLREKSVAVEKHAERVASLVAEKVEVQEQLRKQSARVASLEAEKAQTQEELTEQSVAACERAEKVASLEAQLAEMDWARKQSDEKCKELLEMIEQEQKRTDESLREKDEEIASLEKEVEAKGEICGRAAKASTLERQLSESQETIATLEEQMANHMEAKERAETALTLNQTLHTEQTEKNVVEIQRLQAKLNKAIQVKQDLEHDLQKERDDVKHLQARLHLAQVEQAASGTQLRACTTHPVENCPMDEESGGVLVKKSDSTEVSQITSAVGTGSSPANTEKSTIADTHETPADTTRVDQTPQSRKKKHKPKSKNTPK